MGDFRINGQGGNGRAGRVRQGAPMQPRPEQGRQPGGPQAPQGFGDSISPELAQRMQERRNRLQPMQDGPREPGAPRGRRGEHGHGPQGPGRDRQRGGELGAQRGPREQRPAIDPAQAAEAFIARLDTNGDGQVSKEEAVAHFQARAGVQAPVAVEQPVTPEPPVEATEPVEAAPVEAGAEVGYAEVQAQVLEQLAAYLNEEGLSEELQAQGAAIYESVAALDPTDPEFEARLNEALEPLTSAPVAETPEALQQQVLAQLEALKASEEYAGFSDEQKQLLDEQAAAIAALDPQAADFQTHLGTALGL